MTKIIIWNIRGLASKKKAMQVKDTLHLLCNQCDIIVIIETHCSVSKMNELFPSSFKWVGVDSVGKSGGLVARSTSESIDLSVSKFSDYFMELEISSNNIIKRWLVLYGRFSSRENEALEKEIDIFDGDMILGDFNKCKGPKKDFVDGFIVNGLGGYNTRICKEKKSRLDKVFINIRVLKELNYVWHRPIPIGNKDLISDHKPIEISIGKEEKSKRNFWRFPDYLLIRKDFKGKIEEILKQWVARYKDYGKFNSWFWIVEQIKAFCKSYRRKLKKRDFEDENDIRVKEFLRNKRNLFLEKYALEPNKKLSKLIKSVAPQIQPNLKLAKDFYRNLYKEYDSEYVEDFAQPCNNGDILETPECFSIRRIKNYIKKLRKDIAPGPLGITALFLKKFSKWVAVLLQAEFKYFLSGKKIDSYWKLGRISLIPKKGNLDDMENWRPISVLNIEWKIFTGLINDTLYREWESKMGPSQIGFRKNRWIHENHLLLQAVLKNGWRKRNKKKKNKEASGWIIFVDFKKAYDSVSHDWIKHIIYSLGDKKWEVLISNILEDSFSTIKGDEELIPIKRGVRQGDPLSPLIFNLCIAPLINSLSGGVLICGVRVKSLAFADDLAIFCNSKKELDSLIVKLDKFKSMSGLTVNVNKTKAMRIGNPLFECNAFENVHSYPYLGVDITEKGNVVWDKIEKKIIDRLISVHRVFKYNALLHRVRVINAYALSTAIYALRIANPPKKFFRNINKKIKDTLNKRAKRVCWSRLIASFKDGGFGLFNLEELSDRLKRSWLNYFYSCPKSSFIKFIDNWNEYYKNKKEDKLGPLFNKDCNLPFWYDIKKAWKGVTFNIPFVGRGFSWRNNKLTFIKKLILESNECYPENLNIYNWRKNKFANFIFKNKIIEPSLSDRKMWKVVCKPNLTPAQIKWKQNGFNWLDWAHSLRCASRVKHWAWDAGNINLPVRYKKDKCRVCGEIIGSDHFIRNCALGKYLHRFGKNSLFNHFIVWRLHASRYKNHKDIYNALNYASLWLKAKNVYWIRNFGSCIIKWLIFYKRLFCLPNSNFWKVAWENEV